MGEQGKQNATALTLGQKWHNIHIRNISLQTW
jgi:hypothetical protein